MLVGLMIETASGNQSISSLSRFIQWLIRRTTDR